MKTISLYPNQHIKFPILINDKQYFYKIYKQNIFHNNSIPYITEFKCFHRQLKKFNNKIYISGIPLKINIKNKNYETYIIPYRYVISRVIIDKDNNNSQIIIIGKLLDNIQEGSYNINNIIFHNKISLKCVLKAYSNFVQSKIYCIINNNIAEDILIENQIVYLSKNNTDTKELLLINEETFIKIEFNKNIYYNDKFLFNNINNYSNNHLLNILILFMLVIIKIKCNEK